MAAVPSGNQLTPGAMFYDASTGGIQTVAPTGDGGYAWQDANYDNSGFQQVDPSVLAQQQAQAQAQSTARNNFNTGKNVLWDSLNRAGDNKASEYSLAIDKWLNQDKAAQNAVNAKGVNAEMARNQGVQGIRSMVGNGIKSAGVMLANKNAGSSSAAGALANAYGQLGQRQMQSVGNQYGQAQNQIGLEQQTVDDSRVLQKKTFDTWKTNTVNDIISQAQQSMAALNTDAANASLPDQIAIQQEVERIRGEAMAKLQAFDAQLNNTTQATNREQRMTEGQRLQSLNMAGDNPFQFTTDNVDQQFQYQAPAGGGLPIYTYKNKYQA